MIKMIISLLLLMISLQLSAQQNNPNYVKALADSLGADQYGMRMYTLVILKTGSYTGATKAISDSLFRGHMNNINRLAADGKLVLAGPLGKNDKAYRGIFILNVSNLKEANALLDGDPAIKEKLLDVELYPWYGSAALPLYLPSHAKIEKVKP